MACSKVVLRSAGVIVALATVFLAPPLLAQAPNFGDDAGSFANDGECDDPRFEGDGSATTLLDDDRNHDATDCRTLFGQGRVRLRADAAAASTTSTRPAPASRRGQTGVDFGDDRSRWANDGECDDPRFEGQGSAATLLDDDLNHDATDCRSLFNDGRIALRVASDGRIDFGDDDGEWAKDGECDDPRFEGEGAASTLMDTDLYHDATDCRTLLNQGRVRVHAGGAAGAATTTTADGGRIERGHLENGDNTMSSGELADSYEFDGVRGGRAIVDLRSGEFDPYLLVRAPSGKQFDNDDYEGDSSRSLLAIDLEESGKYRVTVTTYAEGEEGGYTLAIDVGASQATTSLIDRNGSLQAGDETLKSGEFVDAYDFEGSPGQHVSVDLTSRAFDTYLVLRDPRGEQVENDDADDGGTGHSRIDNDLTERGTYRVLVTSYESGETGAYHLTIAPSAGSPERAPSRDVTTLSVGRPSDGRLEGGDQKLESGEYRDIFVFDGTEGQTVRVELASSDFDTYVSVVTPSDEQIANDDFDGDTERSVVEMTLPQTGRYRVLATSYGSEETGAYKLTLTTSARQLTATRRAGGRIFGVFAGISDYPGEDSDLAYTAEDATRIRDALLRGTSMSNADAHTLVDADATRANMTAAIRAVAREAGPEDTFVLFYSGHGNRIPRRSGFDGTDPDGLDETIELYDGSMTDDEVRSLFDEVHARTTLIMLDSCFSGGFAKDVISAPGRMGVFSSEEDVTSQVAAKFRAGGYLSAFLDEGIAGGFADADKNGQVTAIELSQYVHERYRSDVKGPPTEYVRTAGPQSGYQHLVIDRGSIGPFDVLFEH